MSGADGDLLALVSAAVIRDHQAVASIIHKMSDAELAGTLVAAVGELTAMIEADGDPATTLNQWRRLLVEEDRI